MADDALVTPATILFTVHDKSVPITVMRTTYFNLVTPLQSLQFTDVKDIPFIDKTNHFTAMRIADESIGKEIILRKLCAAC